MKNGYDGSHPPSPEQWGIALELGKLHAKLDHAAAAAERKLTKLDQALAHLVELKTLLQTSSAPSTIATVSAAPRSSGSSPVGRLAGKLSIEAAIWMLSQVGPWLLRYIVPFGLALWGMVRVVWKWIEHSLPPFG